MTRGPAAGFRVKIDSSGGTSLTRPVGCLNPISGCRGGHRGIRLARPSPTGRGSPSLISFFYLTLSRLTQLAALRPRFRRIKEPGGRRPLPRARHLRRRVAGPNLRAAPCAPSSTDSGLCTPQGSRLRHFQPQRETTGDGARCLPARSLRARSPVTPPPSPFPAWLQAARGLSRSHRETNSTGGGRQGSDDPECANWVIPTALGAQARLRPKGRTFVVRPSFPPW